MQIISVKTNEDIVKYQKYIYNFEPLYIISFPDNEREPFINIINRIKNSTKPITSIKFVIDDLYDITIGGIIMDYYPECNSIEVIYITILPQYRNKGIGKTLLDSVFDEYPDIKHLFLETDNPEIVPPEQSAINPKQRLDMWFKWNFQIVPIHYVQPPLSNDKDYESNLLLLHKGNNLTKSSLKNFLKYFYHYLGYDENNPYLQKMYDEIDSSNYL